MSSLALRIFAIVCMLIDHLGFALSPVLPLGVTLIMRLIGRLAMPLFCFLIAEGYFHTKSVQKYAGRLLLFALVSEIPFDLFSSMGSSWMNWSEQNVFFTLLLGLLGIHLFDTFALKGKRVLSLLGVLACASLAQLFSSNYGMFGVLFVFVFYCFRTQHGLRALSFCFACLLLGAFTFLVENSAWEWSLVLSFAAAAIVPISLYNGKKGRGTWLTQYLFYLFYPVHQVLIVLFLPLLTAWANQLVALFTR